MKYRPEIDGLRALAVVPVVLFHAGFNLFKGGYVGVDVFFVISGYLITTIIREEMALGEFSLKSFYRRRIRRIIPVLYFVTLLTVIASWFVLMPADFNSITKSVFGVTTFSSNIVFWLQSGYFDTETELKPLLHTWSLAVEEQFYIFFPLLLLFLSRFKAAVFWFVIGTIFIVSLIASERLSFSNPEFTFYQLVTRSWELMLGAIIAVVIMEKRWARTSLTNEVVGLIGIFMIAYAVIFYDDKTPFPGFFALVPTLGTALVILSSGEKTIVSKFLSLKIMTAIGLLSYSIYLWHQPILAFARYRSIGDLSQFSTWLIVLIVIPVSYLSWKYIEIPCRKNLDLKTGVLVVVLAFISSSILALVSAKTEGFDYRITERVFNSDQIHQLNLEILDKQETFRDYGITIQHKLVGATAIKPNNRPVTGKVLIIGDSHSMHLGTGFSHYLADKYDLEIVVNYFEGCVATIGYYKIYDIEQKRERSRQKLCREQLVEWELYLERNKDAFDAVILAGRWNWLINESEYGPRKVREDAVWPMEQEITNLEGVRAARLENFRNAISSTLSYIDNLGLKVLFISQVPLLYKHVKACDVLNNNDCAAPDYELAAHRQDMVDEVLESIKEFDNENIVHFRPFGIFCNERERKCIVSKNKYVYYKDRNHLSELGSLKLSQEIENLYPDFFKNLMAEKNRE